MYAIVVRSTVPGTAGSPQTQIRPPSAWTPEGPSAGSFRGVVPSCSSTPVVRISRQSVGIGTAAAVDAVGEGVPERVGEALDEFGPGVVPGSGTHADSAAAITRTDAAAYASAARRGAMPPRYARRPAGGRPRHARNPRHACADRRMPRVTLAVQGRALREECIR